MYVSHIRTKENEKFLKEITTNQGRVMGNHTDDILADISKSLAVIADVLKDDGIAVSGDIDIGYISGDMKIYTDNYEDKYIKVAERF